MKTLVDVNADVLANVKLGEVEELWVKSTDGLDVQGWLMKPANYEPGKKYPLLLWIHGGPVSMYTVRFSWNYQNFAADDYAVLWTNPRGQHRLWSGVRQRDQLPLSRKGFRRSDGLCRRSHRQRVHR